MSNIKSVKELRADIINGNRPVDARHGVYTWWFKVDTAKTLLKPLGQTCDFERIRKRIIDGKEYAALYFGIAGGKDGLSGRAKWHICQRHSKSSATSGYLSTLRQTLCALGGYDMSDPYGETWVNRLMDGNCYWEWQYTDNAKAIESTELSTNYYPLNIHENKCIDKAAIAILSQLRKKHKK